MEVRCICLEKGLLHYFSLIDNQPLTLVDKVEVCKVKVEGLRRTKNDIVAEQVKDLLGKKSLNEMLECSYKCLQHLHSMNTFKEVNLLYDVSRDKQGVVNGVEVTYQVKEAGMIHSSLSAHAGTQTSDASIHFTLRNLFGRAEQLRTFSSTAFPNWGTTNGLEFYKPYYADLYKRLIVGISNTNYGQPACGYHLSSVGPKIELQFPTRHGSHSLMYMFDWRQLYGFDNRVPMDIRSHAGHSVKSSIKHVLEVDQRDNPLVPSNGYKSKMVQEVSGLGGDVMFGRTELQTEVYKELTANGLVGGASLWCGLLKPFISSSKLNDRFLLGGPTTLRGFEMWGAGPRVCGYSVGGNAYWGLGLHLYHPLPYIDRAGLFGRIRLHAFTTMGSLVSTIDKFSHLIKEVRTSCGIGLQARLGMAVIELNYALPLKALSNDLLKPGLQFGIGMDML